MSLRKSPTLTSEGVPALRENGKKPKRRQSKAVKAKPHAFEHPRRLELATGALAQKIKMLN